MSVCHICSAPPSLTVSCYSSGLLSVAPSHCSGGSKSNGCVASGSVEAIGAGVDLEVGRGAGVSMVPFNELNWSETLPQVS